MVREAGPVGLDRERITGAAVRLLDAEGLGRFSMRRLAGELGVTAMSLYWYVDTKRDLLGLALDRVIGEVPVAADGTQDGSVVGPVVGPVDGPVDGPVGDGRWDLGLRQLACGYRRVLAAHPWAARLAADCDEGGPHARALDSALLRLLDGAGLAGHSRAGAHLAVAHFLRGCGGAGRRVPEGAFGAALDVLIAGITAKARGPAGERVSGMLGA
ncbi:TetR/AcrR family transcriptional regulator C-terminal domain-containing protein [Streptomyces sp. NPDC089799]|uniref:TetR/AcrR family transcriptional regulator n=1 Tax=Streptomyces sp. NPDC089799 TaxID=3155066 RepID=UPI0034255F6D